MDIKLENIIKSLKAFAYKIHNRLRIALISPYVN